MAKVALQKSLEITDGEKVKDTLTKFRAQIHFETDKAVLKMVTPPLKECKDPLKTMDEIIKQLVHLRSLIAG